MTSEHSGSVRSGLGIVALGVIAMGIAAVQYFLFPHAASPPGGEGDLLGMSAGTAAYVLGYGGAGLILIALGIVKIRRARRGE